MLKELATDVEAKKVNFSSYFNETGKKIWVEKFSESVQKYDDEWLAVQLKRNGCFLDKKPFITKTGKTSLRSVPYTAAETFAEGEFNRLYMRAICLRALENTGQVVVYRSKTVEHPRQESESKIGSIVSANELLIDLRNSQGSETRLRIGEPNSGISVKLSK
jgi:hypothetical protein